MAKIIGNVVGMPSPPQETGISWDDIQNGGNRESYKGAFAEWGVEEIIPKHKVEPTDASQELFYNCKKLKRIDKNKFDLSKAEYHPTDETQTTATRLCYMCSELEVFPDIGLQAGHYWQTFLQCTKLHTVEILRVAENVEFGTTAFRRCTNLRNITIEGTIGTSINFVQCPSLSVESIKNIITHLKQYPNNATYKPEVAFNPTAFSFLAAEGATSPNGNSWADYVGDLGWTLSA